MQRHGAGGCCGNRGLAGMCAVKVREVSTDYSEVGAGMDFRLTEEQRDIRRMTRDFAQDRIAPGAAERDRDKIFPRELFTELGGLGLMGACIPEEYGGAGTDFLAYILALEELSRADAGVGVTVAVQTSLATLPIVTFGTEEQKRKWVPPLARGEVIGAYCLTEPGAGSDAAAVAATARRDGDSYILNGTKQFVSNAGHAGTFTVFARTDPAETRAKGVSAFIVSRDWEGVSVDREEDKLGIRSSSTASVVLKDVRVPADCLLGEENRGFSIAMQTLDSGRIGIAAQAVGITQAAFDAAVDYARERSAFDRPIADFQGIQWKLADMDKDLDAARLLTYRAAWLKMKGQSCTAEGAKAKLFASEMCRQHTAEALQIFGGYGYTKDYPVERHYRDAKITEIYEGTSEVQRIVIARNVLRR